MVGVALADGRLRVVHAMAMRTSYRDLYEEAEAGFDPASLIARHRGRPSISGRAGHSNRVDIRVDDETYHAIRRLAAQDNRKISDVAREAIQPFLEAS